MPYLTALGALAARVRPVAGCSYERRPFMGNGNPLIMPRLCNAGIRDGTCGNREVVGRAPYRASRSRRGDQIHDRDQAFRLDAYPAPQEEEAAPEGHDHQARERTH